MRYVIPSIDQPLFTEYDGSLRSLERSFKRAGMPIRFLAGAMPIGKTVHIMFQGKCESAVCIEGDSPAQAVKDVAAAVKL